jgi:hypothetical protein
VRWRLCFALSLAFRLLARIVVLALTVFFTCGSHPDGMGLFSNGIFIDGHHLKRDRGFQGEISIAALRGGNARSV